MNDTPPRKGCVRACERCRKSKVRCLTDAIARAGKCKRCHKAGTDCVFPLTTGSQQRRRRTDARIASIEKKLAAVNAAISKDEVLQMLTPSSTFGTSDLTGGDIGTLVSAPPSKAQTPSKSGDLASSSIRGLLSNRPPSSLAAGLSVDHEDAIPGYVDQSLLSTDQAKILLGDFRGKIVQEYPIVVLSDSDSFDTLRSDKPILLFAIITSASQGRCPILFRKLHRKLQQSLAEKAILEGQKSLELIQAILLVEVWYCPPHDLSRLNFCQWANIAGTMALQLGMIGKNRHAAYRAKRVGDLGEVTDNVLAYWRTIIVVSLIVSTIAISLHRQAIFGLEYASQDCFDLLSKSSTLLCDHRLIAWARLQRVAEEVEALRGDWSADMNHQISKLKLQQLESGLDEWRQSLAGGVMNASLNIHLLYCRCKLFELAMLTQLRHNKAPDLDSRRYNEEGSVQDVDTIDTPSLVKAVMSVIQCCHNIIDLVCQTNVQQYLDWPTVTTVRALYAINTLSALQKSFVEHRNIISRFVDKNSIMLDRYSYRLRIFLHKAEGSQEHVVPKMVLSTLDQAARQPYLLHDSSLHKQIFRTNQVNSRNTAIEAQSSLCNDLEAVVVSTMSNTSQLEQRSVSVRNSPNDPLPHNNSSEASAAHTIDHVASLHLPLHESIDASITHLSEFDLMCMPDLMTGTSLSPVIDNDEMNLFMPPGIEFGPSISTYLSSAWL